MTWNPAHGHANAGWLTRTYINQLCADIEYSLKNLPRAIDNGNGERKSENFVLSARLNNDDDDDDDNDDISLYIPNLTGFREESVYIDNIWIACTYFCYFPQ